MPAAKPKVKLVCAVCEVLYDVQPHRAKRSKYCSFTCKQVGAARASSLVQIEKFRGKGRPDVYVKYWGKHMHRVVAEKKIGRKLEKWEIVHHIDGNKHNNSPDNLLVMSQSDHIKLHHSEMMEARKNKRGY